MDRQILSAQELFDLRNACAKILHEVGPSGAEYDEILNQQDPLERYHSERHALNELRSQSRKPEPARARPRKQSEVDTRATPYVHVPTNAARDFNKTTMGHSRTRSSDHGQPTFEPLEPYNTTVSGSYRPRKPIGDDPISQIRATLDTRPKTSAAACIDYTGPSADTSSSTSRTGTIFDPVRPSTGFTSQALTPANEISSSKRGSEHLGPDAAATSVVDATARAWMTQELARRREQPESAARSRKPSRKTSVHSKNLNGVSEIDRPPSRAGSIRSGIKDYIRPRASSDSMRSYRSENNSRPQSRSQSRDRDGGRPGHSSWWRGASAGLRRKGSWSSFRSVRTDDGDDANMDGDARDGRGPDLNRALPALPGLDQYVEKKEARLHISQLMARRDRPSQQPNKFNLERAGASPPAPIGLSIHTGGAKVVDEYGLTRTLSAEEEKHRQQDLRRLVQEKMLHGALSPTASTGGASFERANSQRVSRERTDDADRGRGRAHDRTSSVKLVGGPVGLIRDGDGVDEKSPVAVQALELERKTSTPLQSQAQSQSQPLAETSPNGNRNRGHKKTGGGGGFKSRFSRLLGGEKRMVSTT